MSANIKVKNNGSLEISGDFILVDADNNQFDLSGRTKISICRCGQSGNSPFCDGSHSRCDFKSEVKARILPPPATK